MLNEPNLNAYAPRATGAPAADYVEQMFAPDGWGTKLMTRIGKIRFLSKRQGDAFRAFAETCIEGDSFSIEEMILASEAGKSRRVPAGRLNEGIYFVEGPGAMDPRLLKTLMMRSVPGLCGLLSVCPGAELSVPQNCSPADFVRSRFFFLLERDAAAIDRAYAQMGQCRLVRVGTVLPDRLSFRDGTGESWSKPMKELLPSGRIAMEIGDDCDGFFHDGAQAALTYYACADLQSNLFFHFPAELTLPQLLTAELGVYDALSAYPVGTQPVRFSAGGSVSLIVPRIYPAAGDRLMALRPKMDENRILIPEELNKLRTYLAQAKTEGLIKGVLPLKRNILSMLDNLCGDGMRFEQEKDFPSGFAVLAVAGRDAEVPGIQVGTFQIREN